MPDDPHPADTAARRALRRLRAVSGPAMARAARDAIERVSGRQHDTMLAEHAGDLSAIRRDAELEGAIAATRREAFQRLLEEISESMLSGYSTTLADEAAGLGLSWSVDEADEIALAGQPIAGHTAREHAEERAAGLAFTLMGLVAGPIIGEAQPEDLPARIEEATHKWAEGGARLVADAWHAGRSAAITGMRDALRDD